MSVTNPRLFSSGRRVPRYSAVAASTDYGGKSMELSADVYLRVRRELLFGGLEAFLVDEF